ncbi:MAG: entry exclusion 1 domain-containing protein [Pseudobdellovibrionaceae bacterium]
MAKVSVQKAAELTGKSDATIRRGMKSGRISFEVDAAGDKVIDTSELERVYGALVSKSASESEAIVRAELQRAQDMLDMERVKMRVRSLEDRLHMTEEQLTDMREQRDLWQKQAQQLMITNQTSQKQAEDLKQEMREREARERAARQRQLEERLKRQAENENRYAQEEQAAAADSQTPIWTKLLNKLRAA